MIECSTLRKSLVSYIKLHKLSSSASALTATGIHTGIKPGLHGVTIDIKMLWRVIN